jgi:hypothetical protein
MVNKNVNHPIICIFYVSLGQALFFLLVQKIEIKIFWEQSDKLKYRALDRYNHENNY